MKAIPAPFLDYWHLNSRNSFYTTLKKKKKKKKKSSTRTRSHDRLIISTPLASSRYDRSIFLTEIQYLFARLLLVGNFLRILLLLSYKKERKGRKNECTSAHCVCNAFAVVAGKYVQQHCCIRTSSAQKNNIVIIIIIYHLLLHGILWWLRLHLCFCHQERLSASTDKNSWEGYNDWGSSSLLFFFFSSPPTTKPFYFNSRS